MRECANARMRECANARMRECALTLLRVHCAYVLVLTCDVRACMCALVNEGVRACMYNIIHACTSAHVCAHLCVCVRACVHACACPRVRARCPSDRPHLPEISGVMHRSGSPWLYIMLCIDIARSRLTAASPATGCC